MNQLVIARPAGYATEAVAKGRATLFALGLWVRLGFIGACLVLTSLVSLSDAEVAYGTVLSFGVTGAALALLSWNRIQNAFRHERFEEALAQRSPH